MSLRAAEDRASGAGLPAFEGSGRRDYRMLLSGGTSPASFGARRPTSKTPTTVLGPIAQAIPISSDGAKLCQTVIQNNTEEQVTWVTSYVSLDHTKTFCVYDGPSEEAIRRAATANGLPIDTIAEVRVLDPYFYGGER
jgi:hypothetical protein